MLTQIKLGRRLRIDALVRLPVAQPVQTRAAVMATPALLVLAAVVSHTLAPWK